MKHNKHMRIGKALLILATHVASCLMLSAAVTETNLALNKAVNVSFTHHNSYSFSIISATIPSAPTANAGSGGLAYQLAANWGAVTDATGYYLDVSTNNAFSSFVTGYNNLNVNNVTTFTVTGLTPGTPYYYRVRAYNASGTSGNSSTITYGTKPLVVVTKPGTGATNTQITANWTAAFGATGYSLDVSTNNTFSSYLPGYGNKDVGNVTSYTITGLTISTTYYYRVRPYNAIGNSGHSAIITYATLPSAPVANAASGATSSQITASWSAVSSATGYYLDVATDNAFSNFVIGYNNLNVNNVTTYNLTGLISGTTYYYRVRAYNGSGTSDNSSTIADITTIGNVPSVPTTNAGSGGLSSQLTANWSAVTDATGYYLDVSTNNAFSSFVTGYNNLNVNNVTTFTVTGLTPGTPYYYRVRAYNASGTSDNSTTITYGTKPLVVVTKPGTGATNTQITANWTAAFGATGYSLDVSTNNTFSSYLPGYGNKDVGNVTNYTVTGLTISTTYYYRVRPYNAIGNSGHSAIITYATLPSAPVANAASGATFSQITASWSAVSSATGYYLDVATDNAFSNFVTGYNDLLVTSTSSTITGLMANTTYYYRVRAKNTSGTSVSSNTIITTTLLATPLATAAGIINATSFTANWGAVLGATEYRLDVSTNNTFATFVPGYNNLLITTTSSNVAGLTANTTYYYRVRAFNGSGNSSYSNEIIVNLQVVPTAPTALTAKASSGSTVDLSWTDNADNENGFIVEVNSGSGFVELATTSSNVITFKSTGLMAGISYSYRIKAFNTAGISGYSNEVPITPPTPPSAPNGLTVKPVSSSQINLSWNDNANNEDGFKIERNSGTGFSEIATVGPNVTVYSNSGLTFGANYTYRVVAYNVAGNSTYSNELAAIAAVAPSAPTILTATALSGTQTNLAWTDNANNEDGFKIERNDGTGFTEIATVGANVTVYNNIGLTPGANYIYRLRAYNIGGTSAYTNEVTVNSPTKPASPSNLQAAAISGSEVKLLWTDNSTNEAGFKIERRTSTSSYVEIASVGQDVTTYLNIDVISGVVYTYRIRAFNSAGSSEYSNEVVPVTVPLAPFGLYTVDDRYLPINIYWQTLDINNIDGFKIERKGETGDFVEIASVESTVRSYSDNNVGSMNLGYTYRIRAFNIAGSSPYSNETAQTKPLAPTGLIVQVAGPNQVSLTWKDNSSNERGFYIQRRAGTENYGTISTPVGSNVTNYNEAGLTSGISYSYRVYAFDTRCNSDYSNEVTVTPASDSPIIPAAPSGLYYQTATGSYAYLVWTDNSTNSDGFKVERRASDGTFAEVASATGTYYSDNSLIPGVTYYYRVRAHNAAGYSLYSNELPIITVVPKSASNLIVNWNNDSHQVKLSWVDNSSDEDGFVIQNKIDNQTDYSDLVNLPPNITNYTYSNTSATKVTYRVYAYRNTVRGQIYLNYSNEVYIDNSVPPAASPKALTASIISGTQVDLRWVDMASNENGFKIERKLPTGDYSMIATLGANAIAYSNTGLDPGNTYTYRVSAFNSTTYQSAPSNEATVALPSVPIAPEVLTSTITSGSQINLSWFDRSNNEDGFRIERKTPTGNYVEIATVGTNVASYSNTGLTGGTNYTYRVCAYNTLGNSAYTNEAITDPTTLPLAPTGLATTVISGTQINLLWIDNSSNETGFKVERNDGSGFIEIATLGANVPSYINTGLIAGANYVYRVRAYDAAGNSGYSNEVSVAAIVPPASPSGLVAAIASGTQINLSWTDNASNEDGFRIERNSGSGFVEIANVSANVSAYNNTGLTAGVNYTYRVRAYNLGGNSEYTNEILASPLTVPIAPSGIVTTVVQGLKINLSWTDNSNNEENFVIERAVGTGSFSQFRTVGSNVTSYTDAIDIKPFTNYTYRIKAYNKGGNSSFLTGTMVTVMPVPSAPILSYKNLTHNGIELNWMNTADNVDGFKIEKRIEGDIYTEIATLPFSNGELYYDEFGLTKGTNYSYRLRAYNATGYSEYSNEINWNSNFSVTAPTLLKAVSSGISQINLTWLDNSNNEEAFFVYRKTGSGDYKNIKSLKANSTSYADVGLTSGIVYTYKVQATTSGYLVSSNETSAIPGATDISAPTSLVITAPFATQKQLVWVDNSTNEVGFKIERRTDISGFSTIGTVGANVTLFVDNNVDSKTVYFYRVTAYNATTNSGSTSEIEAPTSTPVAPSGLIARYVSASKVKLIWTDNSDNEGSFLVTGSSSGNRTTAANQPFFFDTYASAGSSFTYQVCAVNNTGSYSSCSESVTATKPAAIPTMPASFTSTAISSTEIRLTWVNKATNESGVSIVSTSNNDPWVEIANLAPGVTSYTHTGLSAGKTYFYRILAYNYLGSSNSASSSVTIPGPIMAPTNLTAVTGGCSAINLAWTDASTNETGFKIERRTETGTFVEIGTVATDVKTFSDVTIAAGTNYTYRVRAYYSIGSSDYTNDANTTSLSTQTPGSLLASVVSGTQINLAWVDLANNETGYRVERRIGAGSYAEIANLGANVTSYINTTLIKSTSYSYRVRSYNATCISGYSNEVSAIPVDPPAAPTTLKATASSATQIDLTWADNATNEEGFKIERNSVSGFVEIASVAADINTYSNIGLTSDVSYTYRVRAYNAAGISNYSNDANAVPPSAVPVTPPAITISVASATQINLSWADNAINEAGFKIEQKIGTGTFTEIATLTSNITTYNNTGLTEGTKYTYRLRAYNILGNSGYTSEVAATPLASPNAPTGLTGYSNSSTSVVLGWKDNSNVEDGYKVERRQGTGNFIEIANLSPSTVNYTNRELTANTTYTYRVYGYNSKGNSAYSNEVDITPLSIPIAPSNVNAVVLPGHNIKLTWTDSDNESAFFIEVNGMWTYAAQTNITSYLIPNLAAGSYKFRVFAHNSSGESMASNAVIVDMPQGPSGPKALVATPISSTQIDLAWTNTSSTHTSNVIERRTTTGEYQVIATLGHTTVAYSDQTVLPGTSYLYRIYASSDLTGYSYYSNEAIPGSTIPAAPTALIAIPLDGLQIQLTWTDNATNEDGFKIELQDGNLFTQIGTLPANTTTFIHTGLTQWYGYTYRVRAFNATSNSDYSNTISAEARGLANVPVLSVSPIACNKATLTWTCSASNIQYYFIYRKTASGNYGSSIRVSGSTNSYTDVGLTEAQYWYEIVAQSNDGYYSASSNEVTATAQPPSAPTLLTATAVQNSYVDLSWTDKACDEKGFIIEQRVGTGGYAEIATLGPNVTSYRNSGLSAGKKYTYRVRAFHNYGNSDYTNEQIVDWTSTIALYTSATQMNSVESISYDSQNNITGQAIAYSDLLGRGKQTLSRNMSQNSMMVSQTIYDGLGRPAISTLAAPVTQQSLDYVSDFATNPLGKEYDYTNFDKPNFDAISGKVVDYYSVNNTAEPYVPTAAMIGYGTYTFPYVRTEYSKLNPGVARKSTLPGFSHQLASGHTNRTYTMAVPESELKYFVNHVFDGLTDVKLETIGATKTISMDPDDNTSIVYTSASGQQISACYADATAPVQSVTTSFTTENQYCDIHVNVDDNVTLSLGTCNVYNLADDSKSSTVFSGTSYLPAGFYRFEYIGAPAANTTLTYKVYYKGHSFNFYNNAGRSVFSLSPKGYADWKAEGTKSFTTMKKYASYNEYNSLGWLLSSSSPDEGVSTYKYATDGRIRYSQNAQQLIDGSYSYTNYDDANRPIESGLYAGTYATADVAINIAPDPTHSISQWTRTFYDYPLDTITSSKVPQNYTIGKVAKTSTINDSTYYSYTYDGKVEWVVQKIAGLGRKTIEYVYDDDITGRVSKVIYQHGGSDEFTHHYTYDLDGRLEYVYTQKGPNAAEKLQAHYVYYAHGPLKRVELAGNLQGVDYVYTITGQLKSINHPDLTANDPGSDGYVGSPHSSFKPDVFSMELNYYSYDYSSNASPTRVSQNFTSKFNGNISASHWGTRTNNTTGTQSGAYQYTYDNRGFLTLANFGSITNSSFTASGSYNEAITGYDLNGNILGLTRYANQRIDALTYNPQGNHTNQLRSVIDGELQTAITTDIKTQPEKNYLYNAIGQQYWNESEKQYFTYDVYGHVTGIYTDSAKTTPKALYTYNDKGFRIKKEAGGTTTWYVRDASGKILATYTGTTPLLSEVNLYGSARIGEAQANNTTGVIEKYVYELTDHIGNVRATISSNASGGYNVLSYTDYYPFGMEIPGRGLTPSTAYGFGYQGQYAEKDNETTSGYNHFEARDYDSRIGRWLVPDPAGQYHSPYLAMGNNPVSGVDPDGREGTDYYRNSETGVMVYIGDKSWGKNDASRIGKNWEWVGGDDLFGVGSRPIDCYPLNTWVVDKNFFGLDVTSLNVPGFLFSNGDQTAASLGYEYKPTSLFYYDLGVNFPISQGSKGKVDKGSTVIDRLIIYENYTYIKSGLSPVYSDTKSYGFPSLNGFTYTFYDRLNISYQEKGFLYKLFLNKPPFCNPPGSRVQSVEMSWSVYGEGPLKKYK